MSALDAGSISDAISAFLERGRAPALFAGAGVGARAGLPTWTQFMEHLASVADRYEPLTGALIRKRTESGRYLSAAAVFKTCEEIPRGELYKQLTAPFTSPSSPEALHALVSLPFTAIFTTNYDRALHDAYASVAEKSAMTVELGDVTMKTAPFLTEFYIARIHGRAEVPETIVFAENDYQRTEEDECYLDLLRHALTRHSCLFLGFSFVDPAINRVFDVIEARLSPDFPELHLAILPSDADRALQTRLARYNIEAVQYDVSNQHDALWQGVSLAARKLSTEALKKIGVSRPAATLPLETIRRFLATSYARLKMEKELHGLRDIIMDGIVIDILLQAGSEEITFGKISSVLKGHLGVSDRESKRLTQRRIEVLSSRGWCHVSRDVVRPTQETEDVLRNDLGILVDGIVDRIKVRAGQAIVPRLREVALRCIEEILVTRGWDLGAHYAKATAGDVPNVMSTISPAVEKHGASLSHRRREGLVFACYDLLHSPSDREGIVLAELGRVAFGLQLVVNSPCATVVHSAVLPEHVYLDASYLMPAIVEGHPLRPVYVDALRRLSESASVAGMSISVFVTKGFLNEVISHREIALREVEAMSLGNPNALQDHIRYYGTTDVNVFIGAYASWVGRLKEQVSFQQFLNQSAPYRDEPELAKYLEEQGIRAVDLYFEPDHESNYYHRIRHALLDAYEADPRSHYDPKDKVLIEHEARQLAALGLDLGRGLRAVFVSSDMRLRRLAVSSELREPGSAIISHRGLVQMIDLLVGVRTDPVSLTRLFWGGAVADNTILLRDYLINRALEYQDEAMAMSLHEVLETFVPRTVEQAEKEGISLFPGGTVDSKARTARFLDRFEGDFYGEMAIAVERRFPGEFNYARSVQREHLEEHIQQTSKRIDDLRAVLDSAESHGRKTTIRKLLNDLESDLDEYERRLAAIE